MKETMNMTANNQEAVKVDSQVSKDLAEQAVKNQVVENLDGQENEIEKKPVSVSELKANMETYRANIKKGETKNERGQYDEALVLENEAKLKETENEIQRIEEEERKAQKISELQKEIAGYRDLISEAEKKNNEKDVLENEDKLRAIEKQILNIKEHGLEAGLSESVNSEGEINKIREELKIEEAPVEEAPFDPKKNWISEHFKNFEDDAEETPKPIEAAKKENKPLWKKMADFWTSDKGKNLWSWKKKK